MMFAGMPAVTRNQALDQTTQSLRCICTPEIQLRMVST